MSSMSQLYLWDLEVGSNLRDPISEQKSDFDDLLDPVKRNGHDGDGSIALKRTQKGRVALTHPNYERPSCPHRLNYE